MNHSKTSKNNIQKLVAERTSYFCLAHKLIWPLWSSHIFTQWGWLILFSLDHFSGQDKNGENLPNTLFLSTFSNRTDVFTAPFIAAEAQHHEESHLIYGPLESILLDQGFPVEYELDAFNLPHRNTFISPLTLAMSTTMHNSAQTSSYFIIFWRHSRFSLTMTRTTHSWLTTLFLSLTSKHNLCYTYGDHISLRHSTMP